MLQGTTRPDTMPAMPTLIGGEIPLIDVSGFLAGKPGAAEVAAAQLRFAFEHVGFYYLAGHGVPQSLIDAAYAEAARFCGSSYRARAKSVVTRPGAMVLTRMLSGPYSAARFRASCMSAALEMQ